MNDTPIPDWIKKIKESDQQEAAEIEAQRQRQLTAERIIQAEGSVFWKQLLEELHITLDSLQEIGLSGSMADIQTPPSGEQGCQVFVSSSSFFADQTHRNVFYSPSESLIRCHASDGNSLSLRLCISKDNRVGVQADGIFMDAAKTAQYVVEPMVTIIRKG
jgi:hypothetical protein